MSFMLCDIRLAKVDERLAKFLQVSHFFPDMTNIRFAKNSSKHDYSTNYQDISNLLIVSSSSTDIRDIKAWVSVHQSQLGLT